MPPNTTPVSSPTTDGPQQEFPPSNSPNQGRGHGRAITKSNTIEPIGNFGLSENRVDEGVSRQNSFPEYLPVHAGYSTGGNSRTRRPQLLIANQPGYEFHVMASGIDRLGLRPVPVRSLNDDTEPIKALLQSVFKCKRQAERNRLLALKDQAARQHGSVFKSVEAALKHYYRLIDESLDVSDLELCPADLVVIPAQQEVVTTVSQPRRSSWASESDISPETRDLA